MTQTHSLAHVKAHLSELIDTVEATQEHIIVTRHGRPVAVILNPGELEGLEDTLEVLSVPGALEEIRQAEADIDKGDYLTADQLRAKYLGT